MDKKDNRYYGEFGGQYVPQRLKEKLNRIKEEFEKTKSDKNFKNEYLYYLNQFYFLLKHQHKYPPLHQYRS